MKLCDACGSPLQDGCSIGRAIVCRDCYPLLQAEIAKLRKQGKPVNALHIAKRIFREINSAGNYLLRDVPENLWKKVKHRAVDDDDSLRELLLKALKKYLS